MRVDAVLEHLKQSGIDVSAEGGRQVGGGSISRTFKLQCADGPLLLKLQQRDRYDVFDAEIAGLDALRAAAAVAVPAIAASGVAGDCAYLALEWVDFGAKTAAAERRFGAELAALHRHVAEDFGWIRDNYIGSTRQINQRSNDWTRFFADARLGYQLQIAAANGLDAESRTLGARLIDGLDEFFGEHAPQPSLLHGDLWGGNWGVAAGGVPHVFDPAVYFGDREADLAMTRLFGGFGPEFYASYERSWPLASGWERRVELYNLYHLLNHFNLFGGSYASQVLASLRRLTRGSSRDTSS